jgi:hypothetical protein
MSFSDLFQWERFITPAIIKLFFWLVVGIMVLFGLSGIISAAASVMANPVLGIVMLLVSVLSLIAGVILARIVAEFILIVFRINEHLGAIRNRGEL